MLTAPVDEKGNIYTGSTEDNTSEKTVGKGTLGKEAFLNLLVAQMKYQDPLNPSSDTEWISQMATFSSLEAMQNMNTTLNNSQALNLVGSSVTVKYTDSTGQSGLAGGKVDYVVMENGKAYLAVKGGFYSIDDLDMVVDEEYLKQLIADGTVTEPQKPDEEGNDTEDPGDTNNPEDPEDNTET